MDAANQQNIPVLVDPKHTDFSVYRGAFLITPNFKEFQAVVGPCSSEEEIQQKGQKLLHDHNIHAILVTRGERGMTLLQKDLPAYHLLTRAKEVFDVTGAGDTVIATMAAALAAGYSLTDSMMLANTAAGIVVGKLGAATVSVSELRYVLKAALSKEGVLDQSNLLLAVKEAKQRGEKVVMTNGCFDILHPGHIAYLEEAKALGDRLIVAVNDDASVRRLNKGPGRPINSLESRMAVLAGLSSVDWVVPFSQDTPESLVNVILPDVLVKGGDWAVEQIAGSHAVLKNGGQVKSLMFHDGFSTTNVVTRILNEAQDTLAEITD
jgi:D-beta-D-heptose 7-phosphate kinase/D-beta-D-heptose 1-phosphate adenosyltransferase